MSPIPHHRNGLFIPIEIRPHISATLAASFADEARLNVGHGIIRPAIPVKNVILVGRAVVDMAYDPPN